MLSGCGFEGEEYIGIYNCERLELEGQSFEIEEIYPDGFGLELMNWGQAWLNVNGERFYGRWSVGEDNITLDIGGELSYASINEGVCILQLSGSELEHGLLTEGAAFPKEDVVEEETVELGDRQLFWNGDWYGCWQITNAKGIYIDQDGQYFDCFARITVSGDEACSLIFWDELQSAESPVAMLDLILSDSGDESIAGVAVSTGGYFLDSEINETQWNLEPGWNGFDSILAVENGRYEGENGSFDYNILLRPWGRTWEDVEASQPQLVPYFYYDWYLPMLANGETMPDEFTPPGRTIIRNIWIEPEEAAEE